MIDTVFDMLSADYTLSGWYVLFLVVLAGVGGAAMALTMAEAAERHHEGHRATAESNAQRRRARIENAGRRAVRPRPARPTYAGHLPSRRRGRPPRDLGWFHEGLRPVGPPLLPGWQPGQPALRID